MEGKKVIRNWRKDITIQQWLSGMLYIGSRQKLVRKKSEKTWKR